MADELCPAAAGRRVDDGWTRYRTNDIAGAAKSFAGAVDQCPGHLDALTGLGYVALRQGEAVKARALFEQVVQRRPDDVDALVGLGLALSRSGERDRAVDALGKAKKLAPGNAEIQEHLEALGAPARPVTRKALVLPATTSYPARTSGDHLEVATADGWQAFYVNGVNLGAALPGKYPSEFPDAKTYEKWIRQISAMGANSIRVYTIHPPQFYDALDRWNRDHADSPIWLIHGVWTELPEDHDFRGAVWERGFFDEMRRVVDLLHGRADIEHRPGHASGSYTSDVSRWTLAFIIGREWEPFSVAAFNRLRPTETSFEGRYLTVTKATPIDAWLARASNWIVDYEMTTYRAQRPVAYTNWLTLDPLKHPTEATLAEEYEIRRSRGETLARDLSEFDEDSVAADAMLVHATREFPAGFFASFHAYPYYPDFLLLSPAYNRASSSLGRSNFFGYLQELKRHHKGMPLLISEYGVPASIGSAHLQAQGWHHGGITETEMASIDARLTREIAEAGMAGGIVFAWIDEWFKKNWLVAPFEIAGDRDHLWLNRLDPEEHYGMLAEEPRPAVAGATEQARAESWRKIAPLYRDERGTIRAAADEASLWLQVELAEGADELFVGFDTIDPKAGDFRWPDRVGDRLPVGIEFVLRVDRSGARLLADQGANPFAIVPFRPIRGTPVTPVIENSLPGFFSGRMEHISGRPFRTVANDDGIYEPLRVRTNARRFGRDGTEYAALGYDRGILRAGDAPDGLWNATANLNRIEFRIPWQLLNFSDPSQRRILYDGKLEKLPPMIGTTEIEGVRIVAAARQGDRWSNWPSSAKATNVALFTWPKWDVPQWRERQRPVYDALRSTYRSLRPAVLEKGESR